MGDPHCGPCDSLQGIPRAGNYFSFAELESKKGHLGVRTQRNFVTPKDLNVTFIASGADPEVMKH